MKRYHLSFILLVLTCFYINLFAQEQYSGNSDDGNLDRYWEAQKEAMDSQWESQRKAMQENWQDEINHIDEQWDRLIKEQELKQARIKAEIEQKWQAYMASTEKQWVEYNGSKDALSRVDFEDGKVYFEAIMDEGNPMGMEKARQEIEKQAAMVFGREDLAGKKTMESQILNRKGDIIHSSNLNVYLGQEVLPQVKPDPMPFTSKDGVTRRKYSVQVGMVPNHIKVRAEKYLPLVEKNAQRFNIEPELVMAMIHTESHFNPNARSSVNAIGIMQILPRFAGREAYKSIYGEDKIITTEYLLNPENNIELGCAYINLLKYRYFKRVGSEMKKRYLTICGYNCGPTFMRKKIVNKYPLSTMTDADLYYLLRQKTPKETQGYIEKVTKRVPLYIN